MGSAEAQEHLVGILLSLKKIKLDLFIFININIYFFACWIIFRAFIVCRYFLQNVTVSNKK